MLGLLDAFSGSKFFSESLCLFYFSLLPICFLNEEVGIFDEICGLSGSDFFLFLIFEFKFLRAFAAVYAMF